MKKSIMNLGGGRLQVSHKLIRFIDSIMTEMIDDKIEAGFGDAINKGG